MNEIFRFFLVLLNCGQNLHISSVSTVALAEEFPNAKTKSARSLRLIRAFFHCVTHIYLKYSLNACVTIETRHQLVHQNPSPQRKVINGTNEIWTNFLQRNCSSSNAFDIFITWRQFKRRLLIWQMNRLIDCKCLDLFTLVEWKRQSEGESENHDVQIRKKSMVKRQFKVNFLIMHYFAGAFAFTASRWFFTISWNLFLIHILCCASQWHTPFHPRKKDAEKKKKIEPSRIIDKKCT